MVNIIKSEDLTLDEIKSRIISLDSRFAQGEIGFTDRYGVYNALSGKYSEKGINLFTSLLTQLTGRNTVFPYYHVITHKDPQSSKPACDTLELIDEYCKELLKMRNTSKELKDDLRKFCEHVQDARIYSSLNPEADFSNDRDHADSRYYTYIIKTEHKNKSVLLHVYLTESPFSKRKGFTDEYKLVSQPEKRLEEIYVYRAGRVIESDVSQRIAAEFDEIAALIEQFSKNFQDYARAIIDRAHAYKPVPSVIDEYLLTVEIDAFEYDKLIGLNELAKAAYMDSKDLTDITYSFNNSVYSFVRKLRNRIDVYKTINTYTLFDGRDSAKKLANGEMSITKAKEYAKEHNLSEYGDCEIDGYIGGRLENINNLLKYIKNYNTVVYAELTRFKVRTENALNEAFLKTYETTLKELQYSCYPEYGLEKHMIALAHNEETQDELNTLISKWESDVDEIEALVRSIQDDFNKCLARCAKIIEGKN